LVQQVAQGHLGAFAALYDETSPIVYGVALSIMQSPQLADTLTQEVYAEVWRTAACYDPSRGSVLSWLTSMAHRHFVDRVRAMSKESVPERYAVLNGEREFDRGPLDGGSRLDGEPVRKALFSLSPTHREALTLAYFGGYSQTEVARILGLPLGVVKKSMRDGLAVLGEAIGVRS
jgi:RNA polymerase sigma-70 factor (ECF subfamily)